MAKNIEKYIEKLKKNNIRMTSQRLAILEYLSNEGVHPTANDVYHALKDEIPNMSLATVYNNLNFFKEAGILKELPFGDGSSRYDLTETRHYHVICNRCGKIVDFHYPELGNVEEYVEQSTHFKVDGHNLKVTGLCEACQKELG